MSVLNIQSNYLNYLKQKKIKVRIFLKNGINLEGTIKAFDDYMIALNSGDSTKEVYKQAITALSPAKRVSPNKFLNFEK